MRSISFSKFHGFGNDYIVLERADLEEAFPLADLAKKMCNRNSGAGADGIAVIEKLIGNEADVFCEIINPDGSIAGFSGNGTRCAAAYLFHNGLWNVPDLRLKTRSGIKNYHLLSSDAEGKFVFEAEIGTPRFASREIPFSEAADEESIIDYPVRAGRQGLAISCVNVGNPVACVFVSDFHLDWRVIGRELESHTLFPEKANIVFVKILDRENIELKIWERGAGETSASGTCASGAAVLSAFTCRTERKVSVKTEGGTTSVHWRDDGEIVLTGEAEYIYRGEWPIAF